VILEAYGDTFAEVQGLSSRYLAFLNYAFDAKTRRFPQLYGV
jgi:hypothetical protein